jgi:hypothetical protein
MEAAYCQKLVDIVGRYDHSFYELTGTAADNDYATFERRGPAKQFFIGTDHLILPNPRAGQTLEQACDAQDRYCPALDFVTAVLPFTRVSFEPSALVFCGPGLPGCKIPYPHMIDVFENHFFIQESAGHRRPDTRTVAVYTGASINN